MTDYEFKVNQTLEDIDAAGMLAAAFTEDGAKDLKPVIIVRHDADEVMMVCVYVFVPVKAQSDWEKTTYDAKTGQLVQWRGCYFAVASWQVDRTEKEVMQEKMKDFVEDCILVLKNLNPYGPQGDPPQVLKAPPPEVSVQIETGIPPAEGSAPDGSQT